MGVGLSGAERWGGEKSLNSTGFLNGYIERITDRAGRGSADYEP
jgi:hypothetical protein